MEIIASFLILIGSNVAKVATDHYNAAPRRIQRELLVIERDEIDGFERMIRTSEKLSRESR